MFDGESKNKTKEKLINNLFRFKFKKESEIRILTRSQKSKNAHPTGKFGRAMLLDFRFNFDLMLC